MELVTGFAGQAHVDPIDMAHVNAVAFGHDAYLLDTQNKLEPTLETANKLVVDTGDLMIQGHHFTVVQSEEIALQSGVSGQKRNALVCARYEKAEGTGVESASWIVKYGTATTGTPADPSVTTGNILDGVDSVHDEPIFRIEYDGITPGDPILLVPEFQSNAKFRDSISQVSVTVTPYLSNVPNTSVFDCVAYPALRLCHLEATIPSRGRAYGQGTRFTIANVDENYLPQRNVDLNCSCDGNIIPACGLWADGQIVFTAKTGTTSATASVTISGTWRY